MNIEISFFSLLMGIFFSSFFIFAVHLLRNNKAFLKGFGVITILVLYALCICRMCIPIEIPWVEPVWVTKFYNALYEFLKAQCWRTSGTELKVLDVVKYIWFAVAFLLLALLFTQHCRNIFHYSRFRNNRHLRGEEILKTVQAEAKRYYKISLVVYPTADVPQTAGLFKKIILLPAGEYTDEELYYVLTHEYTHFLNRDLLVKMLVNVFVCVFWWNPLLLFLPADLDQMLEIKCDSTVTQKFSNLQKQRYMAVLRRLYDDAKAPKGILRRVISVFSMSFVRRGRREKNLDRAPLVERFDMIANPPKKPMVLYVQVGFYIICAAVMVASYLFIFQPYYEPPSEDIYTNSSVIEVNDISDWYIEKDSDGRYFLFARENDIPIEIDIEAVETLILSGVEIREE